MQFWNYFGNDHFRVSKTWTKSIAVYREKEIVVKFFCGDCVLLKKLYGSISLSVLKLEFLSWPKLISGGVAFSLARYFIQHEMLENDPHIYVSRDPPKGDKECLSWKSMYASLVNVASSWSLHIHGKVIFHCPVGVPEKGGITQCYTRLLGGR